MIIQNATYYLRDSMLESRVIWLFFLLLGWNQLTFAKQTSQQSKRTDSILQFDESFMYNPDSIDQYLEQVYQLEPKQVDSVLIRLGLNYYKKGSYDSALNFYFKGLAFVDDYNMELEKARYLLNIAINYQFQKQFEKSEAFNQQALKIYQQLDDSSHMASIYNNMSLSYADRGEFLKALEYCQLSIGIKKKMGLSEASFNYANLAKAYFLLLEYDSAIKYYHKGLVFIQENPRRDYHSESFIYGYLGEVYTRIGAYDSARNAYKIGLSIADSIGARESKNTLLAGYAEVLNKLGEYDKAYSVLSEQRELSDSLVLSRYNKESAKLDIQYNLLLGEKNTQILKANANAKIYKRELLILIITVITIALCFLVYRYLSKIKMIKREQKRTQYLNEQKMIRLQQEKELKAFKSFHEGQEKERYRVARDLHDGVGGLLASLKFHVQGAVDQNTLYDLTKVIDGIDSAYQEIRFIASNLAPPNFQSSDFSDILNGYLSDLDSLKEMNINLHLDPIQQVNNLPNLIKIELYRIIQELIANIIKHAKANTIDIQLLYYDQAINLIVEDNGIGFDISEKGGGMGVTNIKSRVKAMDGELHIDSVINRGSIFTIDIPLASYRPD